jgi:hypothetical protein
LVSQPASATLDDFSKTNMPSGFFTYVFTASSDAVLTLTGTGSLFSDDPTVTRTHFFYSVQEVPAGSSTDFVYSSGQTLTKTYDLKAGARYVIDLEPTAGGGYRDGALDQLILKTNHFTFDIVAAPSPPPVTSVPEPKTWAMLMVGLALSGGIFRRGRRADAMAARMVASAI